MSGLRRGANFWSGVISEQQKSDVRVSTFCRQRGLSSQTFYRWRQKLRVQSAESKSNRVLPKNDFVELIVAEDESASPSIVQASTLNVASATSLQVIEASLPGGTLLRFTGSVSPTLVARTLAEVDRANGSNSQSAMS